MKLVGGETSFLSQSQRLLLDSQVLTEIKFS